jgi:hypothetical protein
MKVEGILVKLKGSKSRKFLTNYVKRYFVLDLLNQSFSYKLNEKAKIARKFFNLFDIKKVHKHSTIG